MTTRKRLAQRRAIAQRLAELDARNRCTLCRLHSRGTIFVSVATPGRFCCEDCRGRAEELEQIKATL